MTNQVFFFLRSKGRDEFQREMEKKVGTFMFSFPVIKFQVFYLQEKRESSSVS